jgi:tetratricopeptide (TPR) repeat protein
VSLNLIGLSGGLCADVNSAVKSQLTEISQRLEGHDAPGVSVAEFARIEKSLNDILRTNPDLAQARYLRGVVFFNTGRAKEARSDLDAAIKQDSSLGEAFWWRGIASVTSGQPQAAVDDFNAAIKDGEKSPLVYLNLGTAYQQLNKHKEAVQALSTAINLTPSLWQAHFMRANSYSELHDFKPCLEDCDAVLGTQLSVPVKDIALVHKTRGHALMELRRHKEAVEDLTKAIDMLSGEDKVNALYLRGTAYHKQGDEVHAQADLQLATKLDIASATQNTAQNNPLHIFPPRFTNANPPAPSNNNPKADSSPRDRLIHTQGSETIEMDKKIKVLIDKARATLPAVKKRYSKGLPPGQILMVTTRLHDGGRFEQVFVRVNRWEADIITGKLASNVTTPNHRIGERAQLKEKDVLDWTIMKPDGSEEGNLIGKFLDTCK